MSNDKDLSKPVGVPDKCPGVPAWTFADGVDPRRCYAAGWRAGVNSEYVQSLLRRIAELEKWREEFQGKLNAEHVRVPMRAH